MKREELQQELERLKDELEDVREERFFMLEKTNIHVPGSARRQYDEQIRVLEEKIKGIEDKLGL